jgi:hypothetical protein
VVEQDRPFGSFVLLYRAAKHICDLEGKEKERVEIVNPSPFSAGGQTMNRRFTLAACFFLWV